MTQDTSTQQLWAAHVSPRQLRLRPDFAFDPEFYLENYQDLAKAGVDPEAHYQTTGRTEGRLGTTYHKLRAAISDLDSRLATLVTDPALRAALESNQPDICELIFELILLGDPVDRSISHFSERFYLDRYTDLRNVGMSPFLHFIQHGMKEKRVSLRALREHQYTGRQPYDPDKPTLLIALHEFSKTGAPIVGLDLAREAAETHNVVVAALRGGPLLEPLRDHAACVIITDNPNLDFDYFDNPILRHIQMAVLNSVECFLFAPLLVRLGIPWASYIHEYTDYTRPAYKCIFMALYSDLIVFSSEQVRRSWQDLLRDVSFDTARDSVVLPQAPFEMAGLKSMQLKKARKALSALIGTEVDGPRVVVGAGHVQWRKGTDLFVLTAQIARAQGDDTLFVWIGDGLNHEDVSFGVWLDKHMRAAGANQPGSNLHFLPAGPYYPHVMQAADVFYLPSRLDPLPNVVFDAAKAGSHVVLFEQGSGFDDPVYTGEPTIHAVEYGNVAAACETILAIPRKKAKPGATTPDAAKPEVLSRILSSLTARLRAQTDFVAGGGEYDVPVLFTAKPEDAAARAAERDKMWTYGRRLVWPSQDSIKAEIAASDNWMHRNMRIERFAVLDGTEVPRYGVHIHAHYIDDLGGDLLYYKALHAAERIIVTTDTERKVKQIEYISREAGVPVQALLMPNTGRDILPFLRLFSEGHAGADPDEIWCHMHLKKSLSTSATGDVWKRFLLAILLGDNTRISDAIARIAAPETGLVAPMDPYQIGWTDSRRLLPRFADRFPGPLPEHPILFPCGNMFWTRARVAARMNTLFGPVYPWPNEPLPNDGTEFHLIERLWPAVTVMEGLGSLFIEKTDQPRG